MAPEHTKGKKKKGEVPAEPQEQEQAQTEPRRHSNEERAASGEPHHDGTSPHNGGSEEELEEGSGSGEPEVFPETVPLPPQETFLYNVTAAERRIKRKVRRKLMKLLEQAQEQDSITRPATAVAEGVPESTDQEVNQIPEPKPFVLPPTKKERDAQRAVLEKFLRANQPKTNVWHDICEKVRSEKAELNLVLITAGLPPLNYTKDKSYPFKTYSSPPNAQTCSAKDYAEYYIFPHLLPAIHSMLMFARRHRIFQATWCTFNALDYIAEYLYNNNPRHPERMAAPTALYDIPFAKEWLSKYPRKPFPKWLTMDADEAALIIQRAVRGWRVRKRDDVQEMRQFWRDYKKDMEEERRRQLGKTLSAHWSSSLTGIPSPYYDELHGEDDDVIIVPPKTPFTTHSDTCVVCRRFRQFLREKEPKASEVQKQEQQEIRNSRDKETLEADKKPDSKELRGETRETCH